MLWVRSSLLLPAWCCVRDQDRVYSKKNEPLWVSSFTLDPFLCVASQGKKWRDLDNPHFWPFGGWSRKWGGQSWLRGSTLRQEYLKHSFLLSAGHRAFERESAPNLQWDWTALGLSGSLAVIYIDFDSRMVGTLDGLEGESCVTADGHPIAIDGTRETLLLQAVILQSCSHAQRLPLALPSPQDTPELCSLPPPHSPPPLQSSPTTWLLLEQHYSAHTWLFIELFFPPFSVLSRDNYACQVHMQR